MPTSQERKVDKLKALLEVAKEDTVTYEEVAKLTRSLLSAVSDAIKRVSKENESNRASLSKELKDFLREITLAYNATEVASKKAEATSKKRSDELEKLIQASVRELRKEIPDTTYLHLAVEELQKIESPEEYNDTELIIAVEELTNEVEDLKERLEEALKKVGKMSGGGGGGILNIGHWPRHENFTMNGSDTSVTLAQGVAAAGNAIIVRYEGQTLDMTTHYTVDGNKVALTFTPVANTVVSCTYWP